jgi:hypothetical protein
MYFLGGRSPCIGVRQIINIRGKGFATGLLRYLVIFTVIPPANPLVNQNSSSLNYSQAALVQQLQTDPILRESSLEFSGIHSSLEFSGRLENMLENLRTSEMQLLGIQPRQMHPENEEENSLPSTNTSLNSTILGELFFFFDG